MSLPDGSVHTSLPAVPGLPGGGAESGTTCLRLRTQPWGVFQAGPPLTPAPAPPRPPRPHSPACSGRPISLRGSGREEVHTWICASSRRRRASEHLCPVICALCAAQSLFHSFFFNFIFMCNFLYLLLAVLGLRCCSGVSPAAERALSTAPGFSRRAQALECRLRRCGARAWLLHSLQDLQTRPQPRLLHRWAGSLPVSQQEAPCLVPKLALSIQS